MRSRQYRRIFRFSLQIWLHLDEILLNYIFVNDHILLRGLMMANPHKKIIIVVNLSDRTYIIYI